MDNILSYKELEKEFYNNSSIRIEDFFIAINWDAYPQDIYKQRFKTDYFYLMLVNKGKVVLIIDDTEIVVERNSLLICPPATKKQLLDIPKGTQISCIGFTSRFLYDPSIIAAFFSVRFSPKKELMEDDAQRIYQTMKEIENRLYEKDNEPYKRELLYHSFIVLFYEIVGLNFKYNQISTKVLSHKEVLLTRFFQKIEKDFKNIRSVKEYAVKLHITPKYLTETTKEITGKNAKEIIDNFLLAKIKDQLNQADLSISEIAFNFNFNDVSTFSKFFKRLVGITLTEYRKMKSTP